MPSTVSDARTYWAAEQSQVELVRRAMRKYGQHLVRLRASGTLVRSFALMSAHDGWGVDGRRDASRLRIGGDQGEILELHVNAVKPVITNVLSLICAQRPAVKPKAVNADSDTAAQTRLAMQLHDAYESKASAAELDVETVRGGLLTSQWWRLQSWAPNEGEEVGYDETTDSIQYEGDIVEWTQPCWQVAADMVASNVDERKWVLFFRQLPRHDLIAKVKDPTLKEKLANYGTQDVMSNLLGADAAAIWGDVQQLDSMRGDWLDEEDGVIVWELRHLPTPALPSGRLVRWVDEDIVLFDTMRVETPNGPKAVAYPYDKSELHAYDFVPERRPGTTAGTTSMFNLTGLQMLMDICTTSMATTLDKMGISNLWAREEPAAAKKIGKYGGIRILTGTGEPPEVLDFPALKPEVVEAANWIDDRMARDAALNPTVMGDPPKGMPASAQALQRAQAVQYHEVSQRGFVRLISRVANGRLRLLKRFASSERVSEIAGAQGEYEKKSWSAADIAGVEKFDVEPVNPMSATFEGRQSVLEMMGPEVDMMARLDFLQTGSLPKALLSATSRDELIDRNVAMLERGIGLPPVIGVSPTGDPLFPEGGEYVRILKSDPHHLAIPRYLGVLNSAEAKTDERAVAALSAVMESQRLWAALTPDECIAFGIPMLPSHQMAMSAPPPVDGMPPAPPDEPMPSAGDEGAVNLPAPPDSPLTGEESSPDALELPNA